MRTLLVSFVFFSQSALAWGPIGHRIVGELAQRRLTPAVSKKVETLLEGQTLADVANWADLMRSNPDWKKADPWHYVNIEDGKKYKDVPPVKHGDVIWAVENFQEQLKSNSTSQLEKQIALKFLVHFIGDLHQPLHVSRQADRGGNTIKLKWFDSKSNLHEIWDDKLIEMEQLSYTEYVDFLERLKIPDEKVWGQNPLMEWIQESYDMRPLVYSFPKKTKPYWEYEYRYRVHQQMNLRLFKAGVRLANWLNKNLD